MRLEKILEKGRRFILVNFEFLFLISLRFYFLLEILIVKVQTDHGKRNIPNSGIAHVQVETNSLIVTVD